MKNISKETEEKLARSLTYETTEVLPFLPYLLQDFWELGSEPDEMAKLINSTFCTEIPEQTLNI